ncbi:PREDICTED: proline-rich protein HaeIII subfamily 1-like, partial [Vollenhovia emeryi]|uniref:proline-rich protein HaeIII subfamily 1-like n=1 Tax=Vollenhovia emeryi TaxID=411798 RepID=UPI0005F4E5BA
ELPQALISSPSEPLGPRYLHRASFFKASISSSSELHGPRHRTKRAPEGLGTPARILPRVRRRLRDVPPPGHPPGSPERGPPLPPSQPVVPSDPRLRQGPRPPPILGHSYIPWRLEPITSIAARFREQGTQVHRRVDTTEAATQTSPQGSAELQAVPVDVAQQSSPRGTQGTSGLESPPPQTPVGRPRTPGRRRKSSKKLRVQLDKLFGPSPTKPTRKKVGEKENEPPAEDPTPGGSHH